MRRFIVTCQYIIDAENETDAEVAVNGMGLIDPPAVRDGLATFRRFDLTEEDQ